MEAEYKSFIGLPGGGEISRCYYPFKLDPYGKGCSHNCTYCYARSTLSFRGLWGEAAPASFDKIERVFANAFDRNARGHINELLRRRVPLRLGSMTDAFAEAERVHGLTRRVLALLRDYDYPYLILTKSSSIEDYIDVLDPRLAYAQFSITSPYDDIAAKYEPGASSPVARLRACRTLTNAGIYTAVRINPMFPMYKDGHYSLGVVSEPFRYFGWELLDMAAEAGAKTVIAGFVRLSSWNIRWIKDATGEDLRWLFDVEAKQANQALHFSTEEKRYYYEEARDRCNALGIDFSVCYDGDDAYEAFRYLWANHNDCCNALGNIPAFPAVADASIWK